MTAPENAAQTTRTRIRAGVVPQFTLVLLLAFFSDDPSIAHEPDNSTEKREENILGVVDFDTTCSPDVSANFNRAIALLHSFWFDAAVEAFEKVLDLDPTCAMAEWGIALSHWGNPLSSERSTERMRLGAAAVRNAGIEKP